MATQEVYGLGSSEVYDGLNSFRAAHESRDFEIEDVEVIGEGRGDWSAAPDAAGFIGSSSGYSPIGGSNHFTLRTDSANRHSGAVDATLYRTAAIFVAGGEGWVFDGIQTHSIRALFGSSYIARNTIFTESGDVCAIVDGGSGQIWIDNSLIMGKSQCVSGTMILRHCTMLNACQHVGGTATVDNCVSDFDHSFDPSFSGTFSGDYNWANDGTAPGANSGTLSTDPFVGGGSYLLDAGDPNGITGVAPSLAGATPPLTTDAFDALRKTSGTTPGWHELDPDTGGGGDISGDLAEAGAEDTETIAGGVIVSGAVVELSQSATEAIADDSQISGGLSEQSAVATETLSGVAVLTGAIAETSPGSVEALAGLSLVVGSLLEQGTAATETLSAAAVIAGSLAETAQVAAESITDDNFVAGSLGEQASPAAETLSGSVSVSGGLVEVSPLSTEVIGAGTTVVGSLGELSQSATEAISGGFAAVSGAIAEQAAPATEAIAASTRVTGGVVEQTQGSVELLTGLTLIIGGLTETATSATERIRSGVDHHMAPSERVFVVAEESRRFRVEQEIRRFA